MNLLNKADAVAAAHTLWQAALGSGGLAVVADSVTSHGIDVPGAEQGLAVAAAACVAALGSLVKSYVLQRLSARADEPVAESAITGAPVA